MNRPDKQLTIRLRAHEKSMIDRALKRLGLPLQTWARDLLVSAAEGDLIDPAIRSQVHRLTLANALVTRKILETLMAERGQSDKLTIIASDVTTFVASLRGTGDMRDEI
ncbi:MAG: hypothetical protein AAFY34_08510 [Pseudomonadota bacterium]